MGTYGHDVEFLKENGIETLQLVSKDGRSKVLMVPAWQGRVMTSTTEGDDGESYGWINYEHIKAARLSAAFNPFGGEERFWIGPEGGPNSYYFKKGDEQVYSNWRVPAIIDTEAFEVLEANGERVRYAAKTSLENASGNLFEIGIGREVSLLDTDGIAKLLGVHIPAAVQSLAYRTVNTLTNDGDREWTKETGLPSVWLLGCFNPTPATTVFIPFDKEFEGRKVNDEYFGKVPSDRLILDDGVAYFRIDGKFRSKIGLPDGSAKDICGSYDSEKHVLNILKYSVPQGKKSYVNGQWGLQDDPFCGDVINSYNDGPTETGFVQGPFYEIETSSPGAALKAGETLTHTQFTVHLQGEEKDLEPIVKQLFGVTLDQIKTKFKAD